MGDRPVVYLTYEFYRAVKSSTSCRVDRCKSRDVQFHHVVPAEKITEVAKIARNGTLDELIAELRKCVPLCDRHHKEVHNGARRGWLVGKFTNGTPTWDDSEARKHMPFRPFFTGLISNGVLTNDKAG